jgi:hypothetical protein
MEVFEIIQKDVNKKGNGSYDSVMCVAPMPLVRPRRGPMVNRHGRHKSFTDRSQNTEAQV